MMVYVVTFYNDSGDDDFYFENIGVYSTEQLAETARQERAKEEDDGCEFTIDIESFEVDA